MKKIILALAIVLSVGLTAYAQSDGFFKSSGDDNSGRDGAMMINLPGEHGGNGDVGAPLGSGLLILTALGAGYALRKRNEE